MYTELGLEKNEFFLHFVSSANHHSQGNCRKHNGRKTSTSRKRNNIRICFEYAFLFPGLILSNCGQPQSLFLWKTVENTRHQPTEEEKCEKCAHPLPNHPNGHETQSACLNLMEEYIWYTTPITTLIAVDIPLMSSLC